MAGLFRRAGVTLCRCVREKLVAGKVRGAVAFRKTLENMEQAAVKRACGIACKKVA